MKKKTILPVNESKTLQLFAMKPIRFIVRIFNLSYDEQFQNLIKREDRIIVSIGSETFWD